MATVLAQQLQKIGAAIGPRDGGYEAAVSHASLLYSASEAADIDTQTIFSNAIHGLEQLSRVDKRFHAFERSLFVPSSLVLDIGKLTQTELASVDKSIIAFLQLLSNHFLNPGCFKVLEYLIRKYKVHQRHVDALMRCGLPFHSTNQFVRLVQACNLDRTEWEFLKPMQKSGAALPRLSLVHRCQKAKALLRVICDTAKEAGTLGSLNKSKVSLYAVLICELLTNSKQVDEDLMRLLLPYILHGVGSNPEGQIISPDYRAATYMILVQLSTVASLASDLVEVVLSQIIKHDEGMDHKHITMVVCHLVAMQPQIKCLPVSVGRSLSNYKNLGEIISVLQSKKARVKPFLDLLIKSLVESGERQALLIDILQHVDLGRSASVTIKAILEKVRVAKDSDETLHQILRLLDSKYPKVFSPCLSEALSKADPNERQNFGTEISKALSNSSRIPLSGSTLPLIDAIDSAIPALRIQAIAQLENLAGNPGESEFLESALLRRLSDDDPNVLFSILSSPVLSSLKPGEVVQNLCKILARTRKAIYEQSDKSVRKTWREVCKKAFRCMVNLPSEVDKRGLIAEILNFGLSTERLFTIAAKFGMSSNHLLFKGVEIGDNKNMRETTAKSPKQKKSKNAPKMAQSVSDPRIQGLNLNFDDCDVEEVAEIYKQCSLSGKIYLNLSLHYGCSKGVKNAMKAVILIVTQDWEALDGETQGNEIGRNGIFEKGGLVSATYFSKPQKTLAKDCIWLLKENLLLSTRGLEKLNDTQDLDLDSIVQELFRRKPLKEFSIHLKTLLQHSGKADLILSHIFGAPAYNEDSEIKIEAVELFQEFPLSSDKSFKVLSLISLLNALSHPQESVRNASLHIIEVLLQTKAIKTGNKHEAELLAAILGQRQKIIEDEASCLKIAQELLSDHQKTSTKKTPNSKSLSCLTKTAVHDLHKKLLESISLLDTDLESHISHFIIKILKPNAGPGILLKHSLEKLGSVLQGNFSHMNGETKALILEIFSLFTPEAFQQIDNEIQNAGVRTLSHIMSHSLEETHTELKEAAFKTISSELFSALDGETQENLLKALFSSLVSASDASIRSLAQKTLERLPLDASNLIPMLRTPDLAPKTPTPTKSGRKKAKTTSVEKDPSQSNSSGDVSWEFITGVLEILQWKKDIKHAEQLSGPLSQILGYLLQKHEESLQIDEKEDLDEDDSVAGITWVSRAGFLIQLTLDALLQVIESSTTSSIKDIGVDLVVKCTSSSHSMNTQSSALKLLARVAEFNPQQVLDVSIQVISSVGKPFSQHDSLSQEIGESTVRAIAPAWIRSGQDLKQLILALLENVSELPIKQSTDLLYALITSLPQEDVLEHVELLLIEKAMEMASKKESSGMEDFTEEKLIELAGHLFQKVPISSRLKAMAGILNVSLTKANEKPEDPEIILVTALITSNLHNGEFIRKSDSSLQPGLQIILANALRQLQALGKEPNKGSSRNQKQALAGVQSLLSELQRVVPAALFISSLLSLVQSGDEVVRRRATQLLSGPFQNVKDPEGVKIALSFCSRIPGLLSPQNPVQTKQAVLISLSSLVKSHGEEGTKEILEITPSLLALSEDESWLVRSSTLATISTLIQNLGIGILPQLPKVVQAILTAFKSLLIQFETSEGALKELSEHAELSLEANISALSALIENIGQFLSPYLADILTFLLHPVILSHTSINSLANDARTNLTANVPTRLLLPALVESLDTSLKAGPKSVENLSHMASLTVQNLDPQTASQHSEILWKFSLSLLEVRQKTDWDANLVSEVENASIKLLMKLIMKLNETQFKPLFMRLLSWGSDATLTGTSILDRQYVFFKVINAIAEGLRGIFVPYYKHILDSIISHLSSGNSQSAKTPKKKRKLSQPQADDKQMTLIRFEVVKALQQRFLYARDEKVEESQFNRILGPLISQLKYIPPQDFIPETQGYPEDLVHSDLYGNLVVETLVQMALSAENDAIWKPLHHQVLMTTRDDDSRIRKRALEVVNGLVQNLGEEYIVLLPEAMPFLAELLEDPELDIQNATKILLKKLEDVSGENLDEYLKS